MVTFYCQKLAKFEFVTANGGPVAPTPSARESAGNCSASFFGKIFLSSPFLKDFRN
jgi:hypothetical protein